MVSEVYDNLTLCSRFAQIIAQKTSATINQKDFQLNNGGARKFATNIASSCLSQEQKIAAVLLT